MVTATCAYVSILVLDTNVPLFHVYISGLVLRSKLSIN